jgi:holo-[acyl-carrier protein] synthase
MIIGVGVDLVYIETIEKSRNIPGFLSKVFSKEEYSLSSESLAGRFAARESLYKALDKKNLFDFRFISVISKESGQPKFKFSNKLDQYLSDKSIHLSISHTEGFAIAFVIIEN